MTSLTARQHHTPKIEAIARGLSQTDSGAYARLFLTTYAAGFVFLFVLLG